MAYDDNYNDLDYEDYERFFNDYEREIADEVESPTVEEIDERLQHPEAYREELQYVRSTHRSKEEAIENKREACKKCNWSSHEFTFDELVSKHRNGMTVRHLPPQPGQSWSTRYLFLDIDNKPQMGHQAPNVSADDLDEILPTLEYEASAYTESTSRKQYKWHIILFLSVPVRTKDEYDIARDEADRRLREALAAFRGIKSLPELADPKVNWQSALYAPYQNDRHDIVLMDLQYDTNGRLCYAPNEAHGERTLSNPTPRAKIEIDNGYFKDTLVPLTSSKFCRWLRQEKLTTVERIDDLEYDFKLQGALPYLRNGASKETRHIEEGERHMRISAFMLKLYAQTRSYNLYMDEHGFGEHKFSDIDIVNSFVHYVEKAFDTVGGYAIDKHVTELRARIDMYRNKSDKEYLDTVAKYSTGKHRFRTRRYTSETAAKICEQYLTADGVVEFESTAFRESYLKDQRVSLPTLKKVASAKGLKIRTGISARGGSRSGSGRKALVTWDTLATKGNVIDGVFQYVGQLSSTEKNFINGQGLKMKKKKSEIKEDKNICFFFSL